MDKPSLKLAQYCAEVDRDGSIKQFLERASAQIPQLETKPNQTKPNQTKPNQTKCIK